MNTARMGLLLRQAALEQRKNRLEKKFEDCRAIRTGA